MFIDSSTSFSYYAYCAGVITGAGDIVLPGVIPGSGSYASSDKTFFKSLFI